VNGRGPLRLDGRAAIITGGARGFGRAVAELLTERGASVVLVDVLGDRLAGTVDDLRSRGASVEGVEASVADPSTATRSVELCLEKWGRLDILVNNAGVGGRHAPIWELTDEEWDEVLDVNLRGTFNFLRAGLPPMVERGWGRVVNLSSVAGKEGTPGAAHYSSSKGAVISLTKVAAKEVAKHGVLVNAITPGAFDTEIRFRPGVDPAVMDTAALLAPLARLGEPSELAQVVGFLVSEEMSFSTGAVFDLSGGRSSY
jgi:3-oxoacyl-[acyl-carrier protein] reductase